MPALANSASSPNKLPAKGTCIVNTFKGDATNAIPMDPVVAPGLDAGIAIAVTGPKGTKPLKQVTKGYYSASLSENSATNPTGTPFLERGTYTVTNGDGGADVKPFSLTLTLPDPDPITWTNKADLANATRGQDLTLKWTTTDPQAAVIISGTSTTPVGSDTIGAGFFCVAPASAGTFTVPGAILSALPASTATAGSIVPPGLLFLGSGVEKDFSTPDLDLGQFAILSLTGIETTFK